MDNQREGLPSGKITGRKDTWVDRLTKQTDRGVNRKANGQNTGWGDKNQDNLKNEDNNKIKNEDNQNMKIN